MTVREALSDGASVLSRTGSDTPFLDASLLLSRASGLSRAALLARGPEDVSAEILSLFGAFVDRRAGGESVAYILGEKEFFGRRFRVDERVLVPRPDTEILVEAVLSSVCRMVSARSGAGEPGGSGYSGIRIHDAFTGSGCVGITLAAELPGAEVTLSDVSQEALDVAGENSRILLGRGLSMFQSDILSAVPGFFDVIAANPPYVTRAETDRIESAANGHDAAAREPRAALDGGADGLRYYRALVPEAEKKLAPGGVLAVEIGEEQGVSVSRLFRAGGFRNVEILADLAGRDRVVRGGKA